MRPTWAATAPPPLTITSPTSLPAGTAGVSYPAVTFTASGGSGKYSWSASGLPGNLSFGTSNNNGLLSGTPLAAGSFTPQFTVNDGNSSTSVRLPLTINSGRAPLMITGPSTLPPGSEGSSYGPVLFTASGGSGGNTWSATGLPSGLTFSASGALAGVPAAGSKNTYTPQFTVRDSSQASDTVTLSLRIIAGLTVFCNPALGPATVGVLYSSSCSTNGSPPFSWNIIGTLPPGLSLTPSGNTATVSGTPASTGLYNYSVQVTDASQQTATQDFSGLISAPLKIITTSLPAAVMGSPYSQNLQASGGAGGNNWTLIGGFLPGGLSLATSGLISGTPTAGGTFNFTVKVTDLSQTTDTKALSITSGNNLLTAAPAQLFFTAQQGGPAPPLQSISVFATGATFTVSTGGGSWLAASPGSGQTPGVVNVSVDPNVAGPGPHTGTVTISGIGTTPASVTVNVSFVVASGPPQLSVSPAFINEPAVLNGPPVQRQFSVTNIGTGTLTFTVQALGNPGWLTVLTPSGTAAAGVPAGVNLGLNPAGLKPGTNTAPVQVSGGGQTQTVIVTLTVSSQTQTILLTQAGLDFTAVAGGLAPPTQDFGVLNTGIGAMNWSVKAAPLSGGNTWLKATPSNGSSVGGSNVVPTVTVSVDPAGLLCGNAPCPPGQYFGNVQITAPGAANSPQMVVVVFNLLPAVQTPKPLALPSGAILVGDAGGPSPAAATISLTNLGSAAVTFSSTVSTDDGQSWLTQSPASGSVASGTPVTMTLKANTAGLSAGIRQGTVRVAFSDGTVREISVALVLASAPGSSAIRETMAGAASARAATGSCPASQLTLVAAGDVSPNADLVALQPARLQMKIADCNKQDVNTGSVQATFDNQDSLVTLTARQGGIWEGSWAPSSRAATVMVKVVAISIQGVNVQSGAAVFPVTVAANSNSLVARPAGVFNAASYAPTQQISPGSWTALFGEQMADGAEQTGSVPFPNNLQNTQVTMGGQPLPLYFVNPGQVNALIPQGLNPNTHQQLEVIRHGSTASMPIDVVVADLQPGIFTMNQQGTGQGAVLLANTAVVAGPVAGNGSSRPVKRGDYVQIYCTGLGPVTNPPIDGALATASPLSMTVNTPQVSFGGVAGPPVSFSGLAPGQIGLYQINVQIPPNAPTGDTVSLVVSIGPAVSNTVTIAIQ